MVQHHKLTEMVAMTPLKDSRGVNVKPGDPCFLHPRAAQAAATSQRAFYKQELKPEQHTPDVVLDITDFSLPELPAVPDELPEDPAEIWAMVATDAIGIVHNCESVALLEFWLAKEQDRARPRRTVLSAIADRAEMLGVDVE